MTTVAYTFYKIILFFLKQRIGEEEFKCYFPPMAIENRDNPLDSPIEGCIPELLVSFFTIYQPQVYTKFTQNDSLLTPLAAYIYIFDGGSFSRQ